MRDAVEQDIGIDAMSAMENRKMLVRKPLRKAITTCFVLGLSEGEIKTAINLAYMHSRAIRQEKWRQKYENDEAAE